MAVKRFQAETQPLAQVQTSTAGAQARVSQLAELGQTLDELRAAARPMAQRAVTQRAEDKARGDVLSGDFKTSKSPTFAAEAYNRAGLNIALSELEIEMRGRVSEIYQEAKHNPAELKTRFDAYAEEMQSGLAGGMEDIIPQFRSMYAKTTQAYMMDARNNYETVLNSENTAKAMQVIEMRMNDAERFARLSDIDPEAQMALLEESQQFDSVLIEHGPKEAFSFRGTEYPADPTRSGAFDPTDMEKYSQAWAERTQEAAIMGGFERAANKEAFLERFEKRERSRKGSPFSMDQVDNLANRMQVEINRQKAQSDAFKTQLSKEITEAEKVFDAGKTPANLLALRKAAKPYPDLLAKIDGAQEDAGHAANFSRVRPETQDAILNQLRNTKVATARQVELQTRLERIAAETKTLLNNDPVTLLARNQQMDISLVDVSNPATFADRSTEAGFLKSYYGIDHHGLTKSEVAGISTMLETQSADENAAYLSGLRNGMDDERLNALMQEIMPKNPEFAAAAGLAPIAPNVSAEILQGIDILKTETGMIPPRADILSITDEFFGDAAIGGNRSMLEKAALALDAARRARIGRTAAAQFDRDDFEQALEDVTGGVYEYRGKKIIAPAHGVDDDTFKDMMDALTQDDIQGAMIPDPLTGILQPVTVEQIQKSASLQSTKAGRYLVFMGDGFLRTEDRELYELDIGSMLPDLMQRIRRPATFMGAELSTSTGGRS